MRKCLIMTVGTGVGGGLEATESIAHAIRVSIKRQNPTEVVFIVTRESAEKTIPILEREHGETPPHRMVHIENMNNVNEVHSKIREEAEKMKKRGYEVTIDFTSGTKAMSAGAVLAAVDEMTSISYVAGERKEGKVREGREEILISKPITGILSRMEGVFARLFDTYQFSACLQVLDNLEEAAGKTESTEACRRVVEGYRLWDLFDHAEAWKVLEREKIPAGNKKFLALIAKTREGLGKDQSIQPREKQYLMVDLLNNAERRAEEGKFDDAVARLYRLTEMLAHYRLELDHGIAPSDVDPSTLPNRLREEYERKRDAEGKIKLGVHGSLTLLQEIEDPLGKLKEEAEFKDLLKRRNSSILAHGLEPVGERVYRRFHSRIVEVLESVIGEGMEMKELCKFPSFEELGLRFLAL